MKQWFVELSCGGAKGEVRLGPWANERTAERVARSMSANGDVELATVVGVEVDVSADRAASGEPGRGGDPERDGDETSSLAS